MSAYDAGAIVVLEWPESVRKRPGMYIGSVDERGLHHMVCETVESAANEVLSGRATRVEVALTADGGVRVAHDGVHPYDLAQVLTTLPAGWPAGHEDRRRIAWGGTLPAVVNALSARLVAEERRDGVPARQEYARGERIVPSAGEDLADGTAITFHPDPEIFETVAFDYPTLVEHLRELALLNRELDITLTDERTTPPRTERLHHPAGPVDFTTRLGGDPADTLTLRTTDERMHGTLELALSWTGGGGVHCYANSRPTDGGAHLAGFHDGLAAALGRPDPPAGLTAVVSVKLDRLDLEGATRRTLGNAPVRACVAEAVRRAVTDRLVARPRPASG
ncbi:DNA gyrase subunit B [Kitasatospora sp. NPDC057198]|uniref:DNA gyrase subunit B n=1 Tax=Kitasatospora sp. NPDC057198 TaxID=3346046 RepID=UPI00362FE670